MRTTKDFLDFCFTQATREIGKAQEVNSLLFFDFCYDNPGMFVKASLEFNNPVLDEVHADIKIARDLIQEAGNKLNTASLNTYLNQHQLGSRIQTRAEEITRNIFDDDMSPHERDRYMLPIKISLDISDGTEEYEMHTVMLDPKVVNSKRTKHSRNVLEKAGVSDFYQLLKVNGFYQPKYRLLLGNPNDYGWDPTLVPLGLSTEVLDDKTNRKLLNLVNTARKIHTVSEQVSDHRYGWKAHTTLAKCQADNVVWPIIERDPEVNHRIANMKAREIQRKEDRERALKLKRERAAATRKAKLEALERGEKIEQPNVEGIDKTTANLIRGINRIGGQ